jgi:hypothetical protein
VSNIFAKQSPIRCQGLRFEVGRVETQDIAERLWNRSIQLAGLGVCKTILLAIEDIDASRINPLLSLLREGRHQRETIFINPGWIAS